MLEADANDLIDSSRQPVAKHRSREVQVCSELTKEVERHRLTRKEVGLEAPGAQHLVRLRIGEAMLRLGFDRRSQEVDAVSRGEVEIDAAPDRRGLRALVSRAHRLAADWPAVGLTPQGLAESGEALERAGWQIPGDRVHREPALLRTKHLFGAVTIDEHAACLGHGWDSVQRLDGSGADSRSGAFERLGCADQEFRVVPHHASVIVIAAASGSPRTPT